MANSELEKIYLDNLHIDNDIALNLFGFVPTFTINKYMESVGFLANKMYYLETRKIPRSFFDLLETGILNDGLFKTLNKYKEQLQALADSSGTNLLEINKLVAKSFKKIDLRANEFDLQEKQRANQELREMIRKAVSSSKESFIKRTVEVLSSEFKKNCYFRQSNDTRTISPQSFANFVYDNESYRIQLQNSIYEFRYNPSEEYIKKLCMIVVDKEYTFDDLLIYLGIEKPICYDKYLRVITANRLSNNYRRRFNNEFANLTDKEKIELVEYIQLKIKSFDNGGELTDNNKYRSNYTPDQLALINDVCSLLHESNSSISVSMRGFVFSTDEVLFDEEKDICKDYDESVKLAKKINNAIYKLYRDQLNSLNSFVTSYKRDLFDDKNYAVIGDRFLSSDAINSIIDEVNFENLSKLDKQQLELLRKFLNEGSLLATYLYGNISKDEVVSIINSFGYLCSDSLKIDFSIRNIEKIIKQAGILKYVDDYSISLIGIDILSKIINYNQFSNGDVDEETIRKRVRRVVDLAVRSERVQTSSLPFNCNVRIGDYSLVRYRNNDPEIFTSGVDTNTCFFVGVNENDFFFYSLLNKNGYVVKIVDKDNKILARISCFRKNNALMINGIRCANNKISSNNKGDVDQFKIIFDLVRTFAYKLIESTTNDEVPIDYVVCNKAGLLESNLFDNQYEQINSLLVNNPLNRYGDDWEEFIHTYDGQEQMLDEAPNSDIGFTTDFGGHFPALLLASRNYMPLLKPSDFSYDDQPATYKRPRKRFDLKLPQELGSYTKRMDRINALSMFYGKDKIDISDVSGYVKPKINMEDLSCAIIGDDWYLLIYRNSDPVLVRANDNEESEKEIRNLPDTIALQLEEELNKKNNNGGDDSPTSFKL